MASTRKIKNIEKESSFAVSPERGHGQGCSMRLCVSAAAAAIVADWPLSCLIASTFFLHPQGTSND